MNGSTKIEQENGPSKITIIRNSSNLTKDENAKPNLQSSGSNENLNKSFSKLLIEPKSYNENNVSKTITLNKVKPAVVLANPLLSSSSSNLSPGNQTSTLINKPKHLVKDLSPLSIQQQSIKPIANFNESIYNRLSTLPFMSSSVRLLDENLQWQEGLQDFLVDQNDYLVIGVLGKKGVGKSTIMSLLAGSSVKEIDSNELFKTGSRDLNGLAQHNTNGINAFVTNERTILLDVQVSQEN